MKMMIIPEDRVEKLRSIEFPERNRIDPIEGDLDGKKIYFLRAELKDNKLFEKALADLEVCEIKDIDTIETKYIDPKTSTEVKPTVTTVDGKTVEKYIVDGKEVNIIEISSKAVLTASKLIGK